VEIRLAFADKSDASREGSTADSAKVKKVGRIDVVVHRPWIGSPGDIVKTAAHGPIAFEQVETFF